MSVRIFKDQAHQEQFDREGFICLPFLLDEEVKELDAFFDELHPNLRENGFFKPIVAVSADPLEKSKCKKMGFNSFLDKPYGFNQMKAFINSFILPC